jgi:hypothetical protein
VLARRADMFWYGAAVEGGEGEEEEEGGRARKAEMREMVYSVTWIRSSRPATERLC